MTREEAEVFLLLLFANQVFCIIIYFVLADSNAYVFLGSDHFQIWVFLCSAFHVHLSIIAQHSRLADIVLFRLSLSGFPSRILKRSARERFPYPYKECLVLSPDRGGLRVFICSAFQAHL